jgi:hypothetical protein
MAIAFRGASAIGNGKHIMTGPIHICGAEPGDVVKIDILVGDLLGVQLPCHCALSCHLPAFLCFRTTRVPGRRLFAHCRMKRTCSLRLYSTVYMYATFGHFWCQHHSAFCC